MNAIFLGEWIGTTLLILFGTGVVANVLTKNSNGNGGGWIVITAGWAVAVFIGVYASANLSGAHLNPAVTLAFWWLGKTAPVEVFSYVSGQFAGAFTGSVLCWLAYKQHMDETENPAHKRGIFATAPQYRNVFWNLASEGIGTFALVFGVLSISAPSASLGSLDALPVALLVFGIGLSLGGPTGYAINPARDLGPRIAYFLLPIKGKADADWSYAWIPVAGPLMGGLIGAVVWNLLIP